MESQDLREKLSLREQVLYSFIFIFGLIFSYAYFMPIGIICGGFLLFQKKSKAFQVMALLIFILQILVIFIFAEMAISAMIVDSNYGG